MKLSGRKFYWQNREWEATAEYKVFSGAVTIECENAHGHKQEIPLDCVKRSLGIGLHDQPLPVLGEELVRMTESDWEKYQRKTIIDGQHYIISAEPTLDGTEPMPSGLVPIKIL